MFKIIIWSIMIIILFALFLLNVLKTKEKDEKYKKMLCHINTMKILLADEADMLQKDEYYKNDSFFKMHNKGTKLNEDVGKIEFEAIGTKEDYYL